MRTRRGVSLVEVLVAALLLTVGVGGSLQALLAAGRLRARAAARERVARVVEARMQWFRTWPCAAGDTVLERTTPDGVLERWTVARTGALLHLAGRARAGNGVDSLRLGLTQVRRCE